MNNEISRRIEAIPDQKIIYVDVGNMKTKDAEKYIEAILREKRKNIDDKPTRFIQFLDFISWMAHFGAFL